MDVGRLEAHVSGEERWKLEHQLPEFHSLTSQFFLGFRHRSTRLSGSLIPKYPDESQHVLAVHSFVCPKSTTAAYLQVSRSPSALSTPNFCCTPTAD